MLGFEADPAEFFHGEPRYPDEYTCMPGWVVATLICTPDVRKRSAAAGRSVPGGPSNDHVLVESKRRRPAVADRRTHSTPLAKIEGRTCDQRDHTIRSTRCIAGRIARHMQHQIIFEYGRLCGATPEIEGGVACEIDQRRRITDRAHLVGESCAGRTIADGQRFKQHLRIERARRTLVAIGRVQAEHQPRCSQSRRPHACARLAALQRLFFDLPDSRLKASGPPRGNNTRPER